ncbi:MAG: methylglyoxal synthase [Clostridia bacterium]|nr:methylglyoxal synthase [Clostridia bacterium]
MQENAYMDLTLPRQKHIALVAHDNKKKDMIAWCKKHADVLGKHFLCGTGTTARLIADATKLPVRAFNSGPLGGDLQIGARIVENTIDCMIFFWDPLAAQPHDPDVKAIMRIAAVYDIPCAFNQSSADFLLSSPFMDDEYTHQVMNFTQNVLGRVETMKK